MFEAKILIAISLAGRLNQMIGSVVSGNFEVFVMQPGEKFHEEIMEQDSDDDGGAARGTSSGTKTAQTILCTSELGLTKLLQLAMGEKETKTVIKAKVILESFLHTEG